MAIQFELEIILVGFGIIGAGCIFYLLYNKRKSFKWLNVIDYGHGHEENNHRYSFRSSTGSSPCPISYSIRFGICSNSKVYASWTSMEWLIDYSKN